MYFDAHDRRRQTAAFASWLDDLRDIEARARILARIRRLEIGNPGDVRPVGSGISEMRIPYGPGYRLYFTKRSEQIVILLCGGDKSSQSSDCQCKATGKGPLK